MLGKIRAYFLTGVVVVAPIGITIWLVWWFVSLFDSWLKPYIPPIYNPDNYLPFTLPGVGLVFALIVITLIGALAANLVGRTLIRIGESTLDRMPIVRSVYKGVKQIFETVLSSNASNFTSVGLVGYPRKGVNVVCFIAREMDSAEIGLKPGTTYYAAFMPTTPNPTSGFLFFIEKSEVTILDLTVEEAAKLVISAGLVTPAQLEEVNASVANEVDTIGSLLNNPEKLLRTGKPVTRNRKKQPAATVKKTSKK